MKRISILSILLCLLISGFAQTTQEDLIWDYIDSYKDLAMQEMEQYKVPASITLAQAIYATKAGSSKTAREANNHFGITCHSNEWKGETYYESNNHSADYCFRKYATVDASYRDHSLFLSKRSRYASLFDYELNDYRSWAAGLKTLGYSGNAKYADTLIALIEKYHLDRFDRKVIQKMGVENPAPVAVKSEPVAEATASVTTENVTAEVKTDPVQVETSPAKVETTPIQTTPEPSSKADESVPKSTVSQTTDKDVTEVLTEEVGVTATEQPKEEPSQATPTAHNVEGVNYFVLNPYDVPFKQAYYPYTSRKVYENNKTKFIIAKKGDTYAKLAASMQLSEKNLRLYNDVYDDSEPIEDEVVYLEMKGTKSDTEYHVLTKGDTYRYIAQRYGIQLKILIKRNSGVLSSYQYGDKICIGCK